MGKAKRNVAAISSPSKQKYSIIIPAAGQGQRMKSYGAKPLIKLGDKTLIQHQLDRIKKAFTQYKVTVVTGFQSTKVEKNLPKGIDHIENPYYEHTNVAYSISLGMSRAETENVLIIYGDLAFNRAALKLPLMGESLISIDTSGQMKKDEVGCVVHNNLVTNMMYGLPLKWGQMMFLTGKELKLWKEIVTSQDCSKWYGFEVLNEIINRGGSLRAFTPKNAVSTDIDTSKDIERARKICEL